MTDGKHEKSKTPEPLDERIGVDLPRVDNHPADVQGKDAERPLAERVEISSGYPAKRYGER